ncbi:MAG: DUF2752 domain-containing protein [Corynebacteriales bacterium]|nr:DUF2752 domain-containing protein [Mycobacteriales bacterium]
MAANPDTGLVEPSAVNQPDGHAPVQLELPPPSRLERLVMRVWTSPAWLAPLGIALCAAAAFSYVLTNNPADSKNDPLGPCAFKALTGYDCPGCGGTRMVWFALHGDVVQAGQHHLIAFLAIPFLLYMYISWGWKRVSKKDTFPMLRISGWVVGAYFATWLAYSVLRNIPVEPFSWFFVS